jgi:hypothetical protein
MCALWAPEYEPPGPGKILDKAREFVIQEFEKSDEEVKDGPDISMCVLVWRSGHEQVDDVCMIGARI